MKKKFKNYFRINIFILIISLFTNYTFAEENSIKIQTDEITKILRCMTCQNLTIYESDTEFSKQIKNEVYRQLNEKKTKEEVIDFIVQRYGEYILLKPRFDKKNLILWMSPFLLIILSFTIILVKFRRN